MNIPITQSHAWQNLQNDLNALSFYREGADFSFLAIQKSTPLGSYLYLPYGPVASSAKGFKNALSALNILMREEKAIFSRIEPQNLTFINYFPRNTEKSKDLSPKETWLLNLTGSDEDYKDRLPSRLLRYYRNKEKNGIIIEKSKNPDDIKYLLNLQKSLAKEKNISTFSENYLKTELKQTFATLYLVKYQPSNPISESKGQPSTPDSATEPESQPSAQNSTLESKIQPPEIIAAGLVFDDGKTRYNLQGAQSDLGRNLHATGILTIELIKDAREKGLETFDFWGIAPEGAPSDHPWAGFTAFKKTFKGQEVIYAGTYDIIRNPTKYHIYKLMRKLHRSFK